jgi:hypothetical protein
MLASAKVLPASFHAPGEMVGENELPWGSEKVLVHSITINDGGEHVAQIISARFKHCSHEVLEGAQAASSETATELAFPPPWFGGAPSHEALY